MTMNDQKQISVRVCMCVYASSVILRFLLNDNEDALTHGNRVAASRFGAESENAGKTSERRSPNNDARNDDENCAVNTRYKK